MEEIAVASSSDSTSRVPAIRGLKPDVIPLLTWPSESFPRHFGNFRSTAYLKRAIPGPIMKTSVSAKSVLPLACAGIAGLIVVTVCLTFSFAQEVTAVPGLPAGWAGKVVDDKPVAGEAENATEYQAFNQFIRHVRNMSPESLAQAVTPGVTGRQLYEDERAQFRGKVVRVTGQLKKLAKIPANEDLKKDGIAELYQGWVEDKFTFDKPTCVIFTDAPAESAKDSPVVLDGYSFKRLKDPTEGLAPLVIGRVLKRQDTGGDSANRTLTDPRSDCPLEWLEHIEDDTPVQGSKDNPDEYTAYNYFVVRARQVPVDLMAKHARAELTFRRLYDADRAKYRGEIVHVEGRLKRLNWIGSNSDLEREGIKDLYEAWIFPADYFSNPTCVIVTELPAGLKPAEEIPGVWASFDGYFFKRYKYKAVDATRLAPLAIGRTLTIKTPPINTEESATFSAYSKYFVPVAVALALAMVAAIVGISRYFRSGDRAVRDRVRQRTAIEFNEPQEPEVREPEVRGQRPEVRENDF